MQDGGRHRDEGSQQTLLSLFPQCCEAIYSSVSGLKAHLANCNKVGSSFHSSLSVVGLVLSFRAHSSSGSSIPRDVDMG